MERVACTLVPVTRQVLVTTINALLERPPLHHSAVHLLRLAGGCPLVDHGALLRRLPSMIRAREVPLPVMAHLYAAVSEFPPDAAVGDGNVLRAAIISEALEVEVSDELAAAQLWSLAASATPEHLEWLAAEVPLAPLQHVKGATSLSRIAEAALGSANQSLMATLDVPSMAGALVPIARRTGRLALKRRVLRALTAFALRGDAVATEGLAATVDGRGLGASPDWLVRHTALLDRADVFTPAMERALAGDVMRCCRLARFNADVSALADTWGAHPGGRRVLTTAVDVVLENWSNAEAVAAAAASASVSEVELAVNVAVISPSSEHVLRAVERLATRGLLAHATPLHCVALLGACVRAAHCSSGGGGGAGADIDDTHPAVRAVLAQAPPLAHIDGSWDAASLTALLQLSKESAFVRARWGKECVATIADHINCGGFTARLRHQLPPELAAAAAQ